MVEGRRERALLAGGGGGGASLLYWLPGLLPGRRSTLGDKVGT